MSTKKIVCCIGLFICLGLADVSAQSDSAAILSPSVSVMIQADSMGYYFVKNDFKNFMKYQHPGLVKMLGGEASLMKTLNDNVKKGMQTLSITNDSPSAPIISDTSIQCTVQQTTVMKIGSTKLEYISTMVCVSYNNGNNWYFLNASGSPLEVIKQVMPELSSELIIQEQKTRKLD